MSFDLPRNTILPVDAVDVRLDPGPHPFESANRAAIEENWRRETDANPALFNGEVVLLSRLAYSGGNLAGRCHAIRYATFLHWRRHRETAPAEHAFAHAMLVSRDGALVAVLDACASRSDTLDTCGWSITKRSSAHDDPPPTAASAATPPINTPLRDNRGWLIAVLLPGRRLWRLGRRSPTR